MIMTPPPHERKQKRYGCERCDATRVHKCISSIIYSPLEFRWKRKQGNLNDLLQNSGITFLIMQWYDEENRQRIRGGLKV
jgi:hypothetical protein